MEVKSRKKVNIILSLDSKFGFQKFSSCTLSFSLVLHFTGNFASLLDIRRNDYCFYFLFLVYLMTYQAVGCCYLQKGASAQAGEGQPGERPPECKQQ